jgi:hypothetical protein
MATLRQAAYEIRNKLGIRSDDHDTRIPQIEKVLGEIWIGVLKDALDKGADMPSGVVEIYECLSVTETNPACEPDCTEYYIELSGSDTFVDLPLDYSILKVSYQSGQPLEWLGTPGQYTMMNDLPFSNKPKGWIRIGQRIYLKNGKWPDGVNFNIWAMPKPTKDKEVPEMYLPIIKDLTYERLAPQQAVVTDKHNDGVE